MSSERTARRRFRRLVPLALLVVLLGVVFVAGASAGPSDCSRGVSSVGPVVLIHGHLAGQKSDLRPRAEACIPGAAG
jgi:hypothetical protein